MNTFGYVGGNPISYGDPFGLLRWENQQSLRPLYPGNYRTFPGQSEQPIDGSIEGITTAEWVVRAKCYCEGGSYKLDEFEVTFTAVMWVGYRLAGEHQSWAVRAEGDHRDDLFRWANSEGKRLAQERENRFKRLTYDSMEACQATASSISGALTSGVRTPFEQTIIDHDRSGRHNWADSNRRP